MARLIAVALAVGLVGCGYLADKKELADWVRSELSVKPEFTDFDIADVALTRESANVFVGWVDFRFEGEEARGPLRVTLDSDSRLYFVEPPSSLVLARQHARFALDFSHYFIRVFEREEEASGHLGPGISVRRTEIYECAKKASAEAQLESGVQAMLLDDIRGRGPARSAAAKDFASRFQRCGEQWKRDHGDEQPWSAKADGPDGPAPSPTDAQLAADRLQKRIEARWKVPAIGGSFYCHVRVMVRHDRTAGAVRFDQPCGNAALHDTLVEAIRGVGALQVPDDITLVTLSFFGDAPPEEVASLAKDIYDRPAREWVRLSQASMNETEREKIEFISETSKRRFGASLEDILYHCARNGFQKVEASEEELNQLFGTLSGSSAADGPPPPWIVAFGSFYEKCTNEPWNYGVPGTSEMRTEAWRR